MSRISQYNKVEEFLEENSVESEESAVEIKPTGKRSLPSRITRMPPKNSLVIDLSREDDFKLF